MMEQIELSATTRDVFGKKVRFLRRQGITPANLYGHNVPSLALQVETPILERTLAQAGRHSLVSLKVKGRRGSKTVVVQAIQADPITDALLHVDFYEVKATEKMKAEIPLVMVGEAPAAKTMGGTLYQSLSALPVECLPKDLPPAIEVDLSQLVELDQAIHVRDIPLGAGLEALADPEEIVVRVARARVRAEEEVAEEIVGEAIEEVAEETVEDTTQE